MNYWHRLKPEYQSYVPEYQSYVPETPHAGTFRKGSRSI